MKIARLFLLIALLMPVMGWQAAAQNWKTIPGSDTVYFSAGAHMSTPVYFTTPKDSSIIRSVVVKSTQAAGTDTIFFLLRGIRDTTAGFNVDRSNCLDTNAPSWMGPHFIRKPDGTEYFFNSRMDTITIRTQASPGDSWTITTDASGIVFKGTVIQAGLLTIDGVQDSFKTISVQAYTAGNPVPHWYNGMVLQLSKNHGWTKTLDLYLFPNRKTEWDYGGIAVDSTQHYRLPSAIGKIDLLQPDIAWKYAPGNEWIRDGHSGISPIDMYNIRFVTHDSIISTMPVGPGLIAVRMKTDRFARTVTGTSPNGDPLLTNASSSAIHTDTIATTVSNHQYLPALLAGTGKYDEVNWRCFSDSFCTGRYIIKHRSLRRTGDVSFLSCLRVYTGVSGVQFRKQDYLTGFGQTYDYNFDSENGSTGLYGEWEYTYLKIGGCTRGTKINVASLGLNNEVGYAQAFIVYPNPANKYFSVTSALPPQPLTTILRNISGQVIRQQSFSETKLNIPTTDIAPGLYFLEVIGKEVRQSFKVLIQH